MKYEIKHRFSGAVLFSLETASLKLCIEAAVKSKISLDYARLDYACLVGACLDGARLDGASLDYACLDGACLDYASLVGARLDGASLDGASLDGARLDGASLDGARLDYASLVGACLDGASLDGARLDGARGKKLTLIGKRPLLQLGPLGSRADYLQSWLTDAGVYVRAGCFLDTLDAFKAAVIKTHGDGIHAQEYAATIALIETHARLWTPEKEAA